MTARIYIVDDEAPARARLRDLLSDISADFPHHIVGEAASGPEALATLAGESDTCPASIVLLDVQMPGMSGLDVARHLTSREPAPAVVFVTAFDDYALKAFEIHALDYLMKPVRAARLLDALRHADSRNTAPAETAAIAAAAELPHDEGGRTVISVHERGRLLLIPVTDIVYFKAELKYVTIRTAEREYLTEESLVALEQEYASSFVRVHRNALVARNAIVGFERVETVKDDDSTGDPHWEVSLRDISERLPVSRRQWPVVKGMVKN